MNYTKNYRLPQWVETDRIQMVDFNQMCADIDAGISQALTTAEEGQQALAESINGNLVAIISNLGAAGKNCRIAWGSYTGTGTYGSGNKTTITPGFYPVLVAVGSASDVSYTGWPWMMMRPCTKAQAPQSASINITWTDTTVSWYNESEAHRQMNQSGVVYYYIAMGYDKNMKTQG